MGLSITRIKGGPFAIVAAWVIILSPLVRAADSSGPEAAVMAGPGETAHEGEGLRLRVDGLVLFLKGRPGESEGRTTFSPFMTLDLAASSKLGLTISFSPPVVRDQAYATHISAYVLFGRGPAFLEVAIGTYYQNTGDGAFPNYRAYTAYLGLCDRSLNGWDLRVGLHAGLRPGGAFAWGLGFGLGGGPR